MRFSSLVWPASALLLAACGSSSSAPSPNAGAPAKTQENALVRSADPAITGQAWCAVSPADANGAQAGIHRYRFIAPTHTNGSLLKDDIVADGAPKAFVVVSPEDHWTWRMKSDTSGNEEFHVQLELQAFDRGNGDWDRIQKLSGPLRPRMEPEQQLLIYNRFDAKNPEIAYPCSAFEESVAVL